MNKKLIIFLFCLLVFFACGKKGDPVYKESKMQVLNNKII